MKVISGGGGIDADGNWYTLPEVEREVSDGYFKRLAAAFKAMPRRPSIMIVLPELIDSLKAAE